MKLEKECYQCISNRARSVIKRISTFSDDVDLIINELEDQTTNVKNEDTWLVNQKLNYIVPAQLGSIRQQFLNDRALNYDYNKEKLIGNKIGKQFYKLKNNSSLNLTELLIYSLVGNGIEFDVGGILKSGDQIIESIDRDLIRLNSDTDIRKKLDEVNIQISKMFTNGSEICYLLDNVGEHYFDKLLIDYIIKQGCKVSIVVKGGPVLNDVCRKDLNGFVNDIEVLDTGSDEIGIFLTRIPPILKQKLFSSDLLIIKGMAQFETLSSEELPIPSLYLFKVKCDPIAKILNKKQGDYLIHYQPKDKSWLS